ncbi:MAG: histone deacetylase [Acidobacteriota bacterium]
MPKYRMLREALVERGVLRPDEIVPVGPAPIEEVRRAHAESYVLGVLTGTLPAEAQRRIGFPWSEALVRRSLASVHGTMLAAEAALGDGISGNLAGGTHHASHDAGAGYCVFNDIAVAARSLLARGLVARVLVVDVDVHQGDGTARIFAGDPRVFTLSIHGAHNFPFRKAESDLDVELPDRCSDDAYLAALRDALDAALARSRPDIVFVQAGVDALEGDLLGRLSLSHDGLAERDRLVIGTMHRLGIPTVLTLGGGYAKPISASVDAHVATYRTAKAIHG